MNTRRVVKKPLASGDRVELLAGDEKGGWGIVVGRNGNAWDVKVYGSDSDVRIFSRNELLK